MPSALEQRSAGYRQPAGIGRLSNDCTVVEFIGIPGSGKSTLATALTRRLTSVASVSMPNRFEYRRRTLSPKEKLRLDAHYAVPFAGYRLSRLVYDVTHARPGIWVVRNSWLKSRYPLVLLDRIHHESCRFCVLDEWLLHRTIDESIRDYSASSTFCRKFAFAQLGFPLVYVHVHVDPAAARTRILGQAHAFRWFAAEAQVDRIEEILALWDERLEALRIEIDRLHLPCIDVDGTADVQTNADLLATRLLDDTGSALH